MAERHVLYARMQDNSIVQLGRATDWHSAIDAWSRVDNARIERNRRAIPYLAGIGPISFYAVRSADDSAWQTDTVRPISALRYRRTRAIPRRHTVEVFEDRRFRATPQHCAMLRTNDALVIGYGHTEQRAVIDARGRAEIAGVI